MARKYKYFSWQPPENPWLYRRSLSTTEQPIYEYWNSEGKRWQLSGFAQGPSELKPTNLRAARKVAGGLPFKLT